MNNEKIKKFFNNKYLEPIKKLLLQGTSPKAIAIGIATAFVLGLFPVLGSTTILISIFAIIFRLNLPLMQIVNFSVYPLQIILLIPLMKLGEIIFGIEKLTYGLGEMVDLIAEDMLNAIIVLGNVTLQGIGAWLIVAPVAALILFFLLFQIIIKINKKIKKAA